MLQGQNRLGPRVVQRKRYTIYYSLIQRSRFPVKLKCHRPWSIALVFIAALLVQEKRLSNWIDQHKKWDPVFSSIQLVENTARCWWLPDLAETTEVDIKYASLNHHWISVHPPERHRHCNFNAYRQFNYFMKWVVVCYFSIWQHYFIAITVRELQLSFGVMYLTHQKRLTVTLLSMIIPLIYEQ